VPAVRQKFHSSPCADFRDRLWLFLRLALERGMSIAAVAGFLGRDEDEVRKKAKELRADWA